MAVVSHRDWTYSDSVGRINNAQVAQGVPPMWFQKTVSIAAADDDTSTYMILPRIPSGYMLASLEYETTGITGGTVYDIGVYDSETGEAVSKDCYASNVDMSVAKTKVAPGDGLAALAGANTQKPVYEVAGKNLTNRKGHYDLVLTGDTVGTGAGTITFRALLVPMG